MRRQWTSDHGTNGIRDKFRVYKPCDARELFAADIVPHDARLGADGEFVFVLRPETDEEAAMALCYYAGLVCERAPVLSDSILQRVSAIAADNGQLTLADLLAAVAKGTT